MEFERVKYFGGCEDLRRKESAYRAYAHGDHAGYVYRDGQGWHARDKTGAIFICQRDRTRNEAATKLVRRLYGE